MKADPTTQPGGRSTPHGEIGLLVLLAVATFFPALAGAFLNFDDPINITEAAALKAPDALRRIWLTFQMPSYLPATGTLWYVESLLFGTDAAAAPWFHGVSLLLHALNGCLVLFVVTRLGLDGFAAWAVAALFVVHPWRVEVVCWATEQKTLLATAFALLAWIAHSQQPDERGRGAGRVLSPVLFALAVLSKPIVVGMVVVLLLDDARRSGESLAKCSRRVTPHLLLALGLGAVQGVKELTALSRDPVGLVLSAIERILLCARTVLYYLTAGWFPRHTLLHPRWDPSAHLWQNWIGLGFVTLAVAISWGLAWRGRGALARLCALGFGASILPVSGIVRTPFELYTFVADRYSYLAHLFVLIAFVEGARGAARRLVWKPAACGLILVWGLQASSWTRSFRDSVIFWSTIIADAKGTALFVARNDLGLALADQNRYDEAVVQYVKALETGLRSAKVENNLGRALLALGKRALAIATFGRLIATHPNDSDGHNNLGIALMEAGQPEKAERQFQEALRIEPGFAEAQANLDRARRERDPRGSTGSRP